MVQSWVLKVTIHCEGCKKKVKKVLQKVQGVYTIDIDSNQNIVTVTGDVDGDSLVRRLLKYGKHSEILSGNNQTTTTTNSSISASIATSDVETNVKEVGENIKEEKFVEIIAPKTDGDSTLNDGEVEPSKVEKSNSERPATATVSYDSGVNPFIVENQPVYTMSYSAVHPSTSYAYYQAPSEMTSSYDYMGYPPPADVTYTPEYYSQDYYSSESYYGSVEPEAPQQGSYDMFSEENPNACNLM